MALPAWVRFWWRHLMWTPMALILGGIALQTAQGFAEFVLRLVATPQAINQANQIAETPSWLLSAGMIVWGVCYWMRNVHNDYLKMDEERARLLSMVDNRVFHAKHELRRISGCLRMAASLAGMAERAPDEKLNEIERLTVLETWKELAAVIGGMAASNITIMTFGVWPPHGNHVARITAYLIVANNIDVFADRLTDGDINPTFSKKLPAPVLEKSVSDNRAAVHQ